jgi:radical SAM superfamily enzyme YgiQ (UPF0313 family)
VRFVLIRPPKIELENTPSVKPHPPLGLALIAAVIKSKGHNVSVIDAAVTEKTYKFSETVVSNKFKKVDSIVVRGLEVNEILERIPHDVEMIGISCMFTTDWLSDRIIIKELGIKFPKALIFAGGEHVSALPELSLLQCPNLKIVVTGEGEETISEIVDAIAKKESIANIDGIVYKDDEGRIISNPRRKRVTNIENIPIPAWEEFELKNYPKHSSDNKDVNLPILATRGCPFLCTFCSSPDMWGTKYIMRSPESVLNEIEHNIENFKTNSFDFFDLTAIIKKKWIMEFAALVKERNINIHWRIPAGTRSEVIDEDVTKALFESGCKFIVYAPESGSPELLKNIKKKVNLNNLKQSIVFARKNNLTVYVNLLIGLPEETFKDKLHTLKFIAELAVVGVNDIGLSFYRFYPGSKLFQDAVDEKIINPELDDYIIENIINLNRFIQINTYGTRFKHYSNTIMSIFYLLVFYTTQLVFQPKLFKNIYKYGTAYGYFHKIWLDIKSFFK